MKRALLFVAVLFPALTLFNACSSSKPATAGKSEEFVDYDEPLAGKEYRTDQDYFRGRGIGESPDVSFVEKLGEQDARAKIAAQVEQVVQDFLKRYDEQYKNQLGIDFSGKSEAITRTLTNQTLKDSEVIDSKKQRNSATGVYRYYVVVAMPKEHIKKALTLRFVIADPNSSLLGSVL